MSTPTLQTTKFGNLTVRIVRPATEPSTAVVVLHQAPGWSPQIAEWLEVLAGQGHLAVAPLLLLHRRGVESVDPGEAFGHDLTAFAKFLPGDDEVREDVSACLSELRSWSIAPKSTGILGFSYGARAAYLAATEHSLGGAVGWYPNGIQRAGYPGNEALPALADRTAALRTPFLGLTGDLDPLLGAGETDEWAAALAAASAATELVRYPGSGHAFDVKTPPGAFVPPGFAHNADDAADGTRRTVEFFQRSLR